MAGIMSEQAKMNETRIIIWANKSGPPLNLSRTPLTEVEIACVGLQYPGPFQPPSLPTLREITLLFVGFLLGTFLADRIFQFVKLSQKKRQDDFSRKQNPHNFGLALTYLVSQFSWPSILLDSALFTIHNGISGPILDSIAVAFAPAIFSIFVLEMRTKAPGAKSFPQFIRRRFGGVAHVLVLGMFLICSISNILKILALSGTTLNVLSDGDCERLTGLLIISVGVFTICFHNGSLPIILYFTTAFVLCATTILATMVFDSPQNFPLGTMDRMFKLLKCNNSRIEDFNASSKPTAVSYIIENGVLRLIQIMVNFFANNANWMVGVALSLNQFSVGFFLASYIIFSVSHLFAVSLGLGYCALSTSLGKPIWELESMVLKPFAVPAFIFGRQGIFLLYCVVISTSVASCTCNVLGLISLILHEFVQTYLKPFKRTESIAVCLLCGKPQGTFSDEQSECRCCSMLDCADCDLDTMQHRMSIKYKVAPFTCRIHGAYRTYQADINLVWSKLVVLVLACITPAAIFLQIKYETMERCRNICTVLTAPLPGIMTLSLFWSRITRKCVWAGLLGSPILGFIISSIYDSATDGGSKIHFFSASGLLVENLTSLFAGFVIPAVWCGLFTESLTDEQAQAVWATTLAIDNPLTPWPELYFHELDLRFSPRLSEGKPPLAEVKRSLRLVRRATIIGVVATITWFLTIWSIISPITDDFSYAHLYVWIFGIRLWNLLGLAACIALPVVLAIAKYWNVRKGSDEDAVITSSEFQTTKTQESGSFAKVRLFGGRKRARQRPTQS